MENQLSNLVLVHLLDQIPSELYELGIDEWQQNARTYQRVCSKIEFVRNQLVRAELPDNRGLEI